MTTEYMENITFDELFVGQHCQLQRTLTQQDIALFAIMSGDVNPAHTNEEFANKSLFHGVIGHGMWSGALISTLLGTEMPGPGTIYLGQELKFRAPVRLGDTVTVSLTVKSKRDDKPIVVFDCLCRNAQGDTVVEGTATVLAPTEKLRLPRPDLPAVELYPTDHYRKLIEQARALEAIRVAVVHPTSASAIQAVVEAEQEGIIQPVLIGPAAKIREAASANGTDISHWTLIDVPHSHAAAAKAVELAVQGEVDALMKGSLHTDELLGAVVPSTSGLRTEHRISHAYVMDTPDYHKPLIITDAAINIAPSLSEKADICINAIGLWRSLFSQEQKPKVALLSAVETVNSHIPSTLDAAALCKMAERGQIADALLDGPLAWDNIVSKEAAEEKGIVSSVAGDADIIVAPNLETGNALAKQMARNRHANVAGIVLGARVPIIMTSRSDSVRTRILSCAVALHLVKARRWGVIK